MPKKPRAASAKPPAPAPSSAPEGVPALPTPGEMIAWLDRFVRGQVRAKRDLAVAVYNHYLSQAVREREGEDLGRFHILLIGPTGVGKTYLVKTLARYLGVPMGFSSATSLVEVGYKGSTVESVVKTLLDQAGGDPRKAERGIVFIDEIDKIRVGETGGRDVSGEGVQNALLTLLDGRRSSGDDSVRHAEVDTGRLLFVCSGAFVKLGEIVRKRLGKSRRTIGFHPRGPERTEEMPDRSVYETLCQAQTSDLVAFGMIPEFVGRFSAISVLHDLSRSDLRAIASEGTERSALVQQARLAALHGIDLVWTEEALGTGARGLSRLIGKALDPVDYRWPELADDGVTKVVVHPACLRGGGEPELHRGRKTMGRSDADLRRQAVVGLPPRPRPVHPSAPSQAGAKSLPEGISDTRGWTDEEIWNVIDGIKNTHLGWKEASGSARSWWGQFEKENRSRPALILRLVEELKIREASIVDFFLAYIYSNTDNIQANLHYLDYLRIKKATS